jgi:putative protease
MKKVELLAPAGDLEKLKIAVEYGADAVYCGAPAFNLRAGAKNMSFSELKEGVAYAHSKGRKVYLTLNIYAHNEDIECLEAFMNNIQGISVDAFIVSDPGILHWLRKNYPNMDIHLSTQANTTNYLAADYWFKQGVKRIILAREMSLKEIAKLRNMVSPELELEAFVHGAMCISYSGRCLLSSFMTGRDSNRGKCAHPCRWNYYLEEEKRPGEYYPIFEDEKGSYILNSKDLCMIEYLPDMIEAGLDTLKIGIIR